MKNNKIILILLLLCSSASLLKAEKCELLDAIQEKYQARKAGHLFFQYQNFSSFANDTNVIDFELYFRPNGLRKPSNLKGFDLNLRKVTYDQDWVKYQDSSFIAVEAKQTLNPKVYSKKLGQDWFFRIQKLPVVESIYFFTLLKLNGVDCQDEDEAFWYLGNDNPKIKYEVQVRKSDSLITWMAYSENMKGGENYYESYRFEEQNFDALSLEANPPMPLAPSFWRDKGYQLPQKSTFDRDAKPLLGKVAPDWTCMSTQNDSLSLADFKGQYLLLDFWYIGCAPCVLAMPGLQALSAEFDESKLRVLGVEAYDKSPERVAAFMQGREVDYTSLIAARTSLIQDYGVQAFPTFFLIDPDGIVIHHQIGYSPRELRKLRKLLNGQLR